MMSDKTEASSHWQPGSCLCTCDADTNRERVHGKVNLAYYNKSKTNWSQQLHFTLGIAQNQNIALKKNWSWNHLHTQQQKKNSQMKKDRVFFCKLSKKKIMATILDRKQTNRSKRNPRKSHRSKFYENSATRDKML